MSPHDGDHYARVVSPHGETATTTDEPSTAPNAPVTSNPLDHAGWLSRLTLWWVNPAITRGRKQTLEEDDIWPLPRDDQAAVLQRDFDRYYQQQRERTTSTSRSSSTPIHGPMWRATKATMVLAIVLHLLNAAAAMLQPMFIKAILQFLQGDANLFGITSGYTLAAALTVTAFVGVTALDYGMYLTARAGICARTIVINSVFQKILRLTSTARQSINSGHIITLAGVDSERLYEAYSIGLWTIISPLMIVTACVLIATEMGTCVGLAALGSAVAILTFGMTNSRRIGLLRRDILAVAGERIQVTNEVLQGIRVIKMYAWETSMQERVREIREREIRLLRHYTNLRAMNYVTLTLGQTIMTATCFIVYVYQGNTLNVPTAFAIMALTNACRVPFSTFSSAVMFTSEGLASLQRIGNFLSADEVKPGVAAFGILEDGQPVIEISDADFTWVGADQEPTTSDAANHDHTTTTTARPILRNINLTIAPGSLTIVVGAVGSGKSSLVSAMLGEMNQLRGRCAVRGSIAYASQQAWIQHNTVRENILFGAPFDAEHYQRVIAACQLTRDLEILENGDATEIGERGIGLSGGQKARVSLARAMYRRDSDLVVLDDPLSALDVHVANAVFFECVAGLAKSKTRLLVLNAHYHLLKHADRILVLADGEIVGDGTYEQVISQFEYLEDQAHDIAAQVEVENAPPTRQMSRAKLSVVKPDFPIEATDIMDEERYGNDNVNAMYFPEGPDAIERMSMSSLPSPASRASRRSRRTKSALIPEDKKPPTLMVEEDRATGSITWRTYAAFFSNSGFNGAGIGVALVCGFALAQCGMLSADYFVTYWSNGSLNQYSQRSLLWMFIGIIVTSAVLAAIRAALYIEVCIQSSKALHAREFEKVLMAPIPTFFDVTPVGRVLNRFSRDLDQIDNPLPYYSMACLIYGMLTLSVFVVCAVTTPTTLILYAPLLFTSQLIQKYFLASSRELKRLDGITRSPFLNLVAETINGIESIRSFRMVDRFSQQCRELLDFNSKFFFMFQTATKWFAMRLDWLVSSVVAVVSFTCVASRQSIGPASVGIALTYAVQLTMQFQRLLTLYSMTENYMTSYERIAHYDSLELEGHTKEVIFQPQKPWPSQGTIDFRNVYLRYRDGLDFVLRGVTFSIHAGEKIGVCGRTGSGKSTLMNALFRTVEPVHGAVLVDCVDITTINLRTLRSNLTIIPQDPVIFSGTLRANLDPFDERTDDELFAALRKVHLIEDVGRWGQGLSYPVSEKGDNLSVGQRQLLCIARALLRDSRIIVLDEATANVDQELDRLIQVTVKESFVGRTALTIAHRLETIADSDRILVMEQGRVAEFDSPANLLAKTDGIFASLMQSTKAE